MQDVYNSSTDEVNHYKERLRIALNAAKICVFEVDLPRQLYTFFENAEVIFGVSGADILKDVQPFSKLDPQAYRIQASNYFSHPDDAAVIEQAFASILSGKPITYEARMKAGNSNFVWCRINVTPLMENGKPVKMIGVITDITDIKEKTESLKQAANLDQFTGLYNKGYTTHAIKAVLAKKPSQRHALILLDIDNFKRFNDTYGHDEGDKIIKFVSQQLKSVFRKTDIIGRFGGDEFMVFIQNVPDDQWLCKKLEHLTHLSMDDFICTTSMGISFSPQDAAAFNNLFKMADRALYRAKKQKKTYLFYSEINSI